MTGGTPITDESGSVAGLTHEWDLRTAYYSARIPIWIDEITDVDEWKAQFTKPEAREVVEAVGAWIYCFNKGDADEEHGSQWTGEVEDTMKAIDQVVHMACGDEWEGTKLAVGLSPTAGKGQELDMEVWENVGLDHGFEVIDAGAEGKNEFGEMVGLARAREALEANDWAGQSSEADGLDLGDEEDGFGAIGPEHSQMNAELWGLKASLLGTGEDEDDEGALQVDDMERMMSQVLSIKGWNILH